MDAEEAGAEAGGMSPSHAQQENGVSESIEETAAVSVLPSLSLEEPQEPRNGAANANGHANGSAENGDAEDGDKSPAPLKPSAKPLSRAPPRRMRSGSGSGSNTSTGSRRDVGVRRAPGSANMGIVVGTLRRRHRATLASRNNSLSDDEAEGPASLESAPRRPKRTKAQRQESLRNMAALMRTHLRKSKSFKPLGSGQSKEDDASSRPTLERSSSSFAGVAQQVVTTRRAARGFLSMWSSGSTEASHVFRGIHMEKKKLDLVSVGAEYKELKRRQFYQELVVYFVFLMLLFSLLSWLPVEESFHQNDVVGHLTCREEGVCELKSFSDLYDFVGTLHETVCEREGVTAQWVRVGGVGFRQVRVSEQRCTVYDGWLAPCYPFYSPEAEDKSPLAGEPGSDRVYNWMDGLGDLSPQLYQSFTDALLFGGAESYGSGGYAVDLCDLEDVSVLQQDTFLSAHTRAVAIEFTLLNPVTRVFTIGLHVFTVDPSGHLEHFAHSSHVRVIGHEQTELFAISSEEKKAAEEAQMGTMDVLTGSVTAVRDAFDVRVLLWVALQLFFFTYCIGEATEMSTMGVRTYLSSDMWNLFELSHLAVLAAILSYMVRYYMASNAFAAHLEALRDGHGVEELSHSSTQDLLTTFQQLSDLASLASAISLLKVFKFLRMNSTLNLLWRVLGMALRDLMGFLVIFNLIFVGYSAMGSYAFGFALEEFSTVAKSYGTCFQMLAGDLDYPRLQQANPRIAPIFIGTFVVLVFQILVNMFVAILSEYYEVAKNDVAGSGEDAEYDVLARIRSYVGAFSPTVVVPKDHGVIRLIPRQQVRLISTNLVDQEETRQRARKLFRGAVWRVVALLRFGMKFDRRIQFGDRKAPQHGGGGNTGSATGPVKEERELVSHIRLSENFDHKTIKEMIPIGITVRLQGDSLLGDGLALKVVHHSKLSVECIVLSPNDVEDRASGGGSPTSSGANSPAGSPTRSGSSPLKSGTNSPSAFRPPRTISSLGSFDESDFDENAGPQERVLELMGGEKLRIPWQRLAMHMGKNLLKELKMGLLSATKLWNYSKDHMVDDYHLSLLFESVRADGRTSLRFDEISRMLDLFLRKDKRKALCSQAEVRREALQVMYRFRKCLIDMPSREKEGHNYRPKPVDTSMVELGHLEHLGDMLARNCHDMWALERLKQGWQYGSERDDAEKKHPNLVPYKLLSVEEQAFDYRSSIETIKTILFMNYTIVRASHKRTNSGASSSTFHDAFSRSASMMSDLTENLGGSNNSLLSGGGGAGSSDATSPRASLNEVAAETTESEATEGNGANIKPMSSLKREAFSFRRSSLMSDSQYFTTYGEGGVEIYRPLPIDTTNVELPPRLLRLVDLLAENAHEVWAKGRMEEGWTYGPQRDDSTKKHPCLVPYVFLTDDEKEYDLNIARETLKTLLAMNFTVLDRSGKF